MKLVFAGTPDFAAASLRALIDAGHDIALVLTQPDRPAGRGLHLHPTPVKALALEHGIDVIQPQGLRLAGRHDADARMAHERLHATPHDAMVVAAYGLILPASVLAIPRRGCLNVHASLLPRWRGAAPIQRAIEAGDVETGITIMQMDEGLDTGDVLLARPLAIAPVDSAATLTARLAGLGGAAIVDALRSLEADTLAARPQVEPGGEGAVTYAAKLSKAEAALDFALDAKTLVDRIRAFDPWPGCGATLFDDAGASSSQFKVWRAEIVAPPTDGPPVGPRAAAGTVLGVRHALQRSALDRGAVLVATGDGVVALTELQKPGGKRLQALAFERDFAGSASLRFAAA